MAADANTTTLTLNDQEIAGVMQKSGGGSPVQRAQEFIRKQLEGGGHEVSLSDVHLGLLIRHMTSGSGAVQAALKRDFQRSLIELISKE